MSLEREIDHSVRYLASDEAKRAASLDPYWPKWHHPWWHMSLLDEMGLSERIPTAILEPFVAALNRIPLKIFPIKPDDMPPGVDPFRGTPCHCQLGNVYRVLAARGVAVDVELPWIKPWFLAYQMADGGLNCDNDAYNVEGECPSSMVGTISAFEAVLLHAPRPWSAAEAAFVEKAVRFLIARELRHGSHTNHNASERKSAESGAKLCFPRYYFYDVLRGLRALTSWSEITGHALPGDAVRHVVATLDAAFLDGTVRVGRRAFEGTGTLGPTPTGAWVRQKASLFPLLEAVSQVGAASPFLTAQWREARAKAVSY